MTLPTEGPSDTKAIESLPSALLAPELRISLLRVSRIMRNQRADISISLTLLSALGTVFANGPLSAGELAAIERVQPPSMTKVIATLEERGLVRRQAHPHDKRQAIIAITPAGEELLAGERRLRNEWLAQRLANLTDEERQLLRAASPVLAKLAEQ
ncbi:MAG TPA: MarR family transcriptional regulator [Jatrophihabitans sp.]